MAMQPQQRPAGTPHSAPRTPRFPGAGACTACQGTGTVAVRGETLACPRCRGSGQKGYLTK